MLSIDSFRFLNEILMLTPFCSPYRFEAPWHAFEFAFHILSVQTNLVIISMAWSTHEDARMFSRMPAEPDMDTLTYWVQRLEPLIRAENDEETIVVFCNRTGKEGNLVYAGTSAVLSIKQGEVAVYGILGRGVKDLLVVDTDVAPFAKLIHRPGWDATETEAEVMPGRYVIPEYTDSRADDDREAAQAPDVVKKSTPTPNTPGRLSKHKTPTPIQIPQAPFRRLPSTTHATPIEESPTIATPTAPSPTPFSQRPRVDISTKEQVNARHPHHEVAQRYQPILGDDAPIVEPNPIAASPNSEQFSEKYFWLPPQPTFKSPFEANFPARPPVSPTVPSSLVRLPGENRNSMKTLPDPERAFSPEVDMEESRSSSIDETATQSHHVQAQSQKTVNGKGKDSAGPARPSSPKSRNASRTGRPLERHASESEQPDLSDMNDRLEAFVRRPGSAMDERHDHVQESRQGRPRTPKARPASRTGRPHIASQLLDDRMISDTRDTVQLIASPSVFSDTTAQSMSEISMGNASSSRKNGEHGAIRPCPRAGARSRNRSITAPDMGHSRSRSGGDTQSINDRVPYIEPDETRTMVWSELSKIVGEVLDRPNSRNASRGRQRVVNRSTSTDAPPAVRASHSEHRGIHSAPRIDRRFASQDRHTGFGGRPARPAVSLNTAVGASEGPFSPYDPDNEIVAEIIFHDRGCPTHRQRQTPGTGNPTPTQATNPISPPFVQRNNSRQSQERNSRMRQRDDMPNLPRKNSFPQKPGAGRSQSGQSGHGERGAFKAPMPLSTMSRFNSNESCPTLDGASMHTIASSNISPVTPPSRSFEPTTPKAMKLDPEFGTIVTSVSDPSGSGDFSHLKSIQNELIGIGLERPRSAVW